jgi:nucleotide-binding universal stress UspA family protein
MKKIIVGIDGSKESFDSYKCVPGFFPKEQINLEAVFVLDERKTQIPFIYSGAAYDVAYERLYIPVDPGLKDFYEKLNKDNRIYADKCMNICNGIEFEPGVHQSEVILEGDPSEQLMEHSKGTDLLALGQRGENASFKRELIGSTSEELIRKAETPVLICPQADGIPGKSLIVYEGSSSSESAFDFYIANFSDIISDLVVLITGHFDDIKIGLGDRLKILENKGVRVVLEHCNGSAAGKALEMMDNYSIETVILGSHGKHKLTEYLLGSVTVHIIRKSRLPVFIVH